MDDLEIQHKVSMEKELPSIQQDYESLNQDQQRIVNNVVNSVKEQLPEIAANHSSNV